MDEIVWMILLVGGGGLFLYVLINASVRQPGHTLQATFVALGTLRGRTKTEIVAAVGPPHAISTIPGGKTLLQWQAAGYHIALGFEADDVCYGVTHEFAQR